MSHLFLLAALFSASVARADVGPKPTVWFAWTDKTELADVKLLQCKDKACNSGEPLPHLGPQGLHCCEAGCYAIAYGFSEMSQLEGSSSGKIVRSEPFETKGMEIYYNVSVANGKIAVTKARREFGEELKNRLRACP